MIWQILASAVNGALVIIVALLSLGISLTVLYGFVFCPLAYIGLSLSTIPLNKYGNRLEWRGKKVKEFNEDEIGFGGLVVWSAVTVGILAGIGYLAKIAGVSLI